MRNSEIDQQIANRNSLRELSALPRLDDRERERLLSARAQRVLEAAYAVERIRFDDWIRECSGFLSKSGRWSQARQQVAKELKVGQHVEHLLKELGYCVVDDAWQTEGRVTYLNDENADRQFLRDLQASLAGSGWARDEHRLRAFTCAATGELIEIEPGGAETSGHLLHHFKSEG
jgi:hypothetical protein